MAGTEGGSAELPDATLFSPEQLALITQLVRAGVDAGSTSTAPVDPVVPPVGGTAQRSQPPVGTTAPPTPGERRAGDPGEQAGACFESKDEPWVREEGRGRDSGAPPPPSPVNYAN